MCDEEKLNNAGGFHGKTCRPALYLASIRRWAACSNIKLSQCRGAIKKGEGIKRAAPSPSPASLFTRMLINSVTYHVGSAPGTSVSSIGDEYSAAG